MIELDVGWLCVKFSNGCPLLSYLSASIVSSTISAMFLIAFYAAAKQQSIKKIQINVQLSAYFMLFI